MMDAASLVKLGMPFPDAFNSLTGELGYLQTGSSFDFGKNTFFIGVRNRENALKLLRHAFIDEISSDTERSRRHLLGARHEQNQRKGKKPSAGNKFYLAVAKDMILVAGSRETLRAPARAKRLLPDGKPLTPFLSVTTTGTLLLTA